MTEPNTTTETEDADLAQIEPPDSAGPAQPASTDASTGAEPTDDALLEMTTEKLAALVRDKRRSEFSLRERLRELEAERDSLNERIADGQRRDVVAAATAAGLLPTAVEDLNGQIDLAALLGEDGEIDSAKVDEALRKVRSERPHWFNRPAASSVDHAGSGEGTPQPTYQWSDVLGGA